MTLKTMMVRNVLRNRPEENIFIRFDENNLIRLPCDYQYNSLLCKEKDNKVMVVRAIETKNKDGSWSQYPSIARLQKKSPVIIFASKIVGKKKRFGIVFSSKEPPDEKLFRAAQQSGLYTETIEE